MNINILNVLGNLLSLIFVGVGIFFLTRKKESTSELLLKQQIDYLKERRGSSRGFLNEPIKWQFCPLRCPDGIVVKGLYSSHGRLQQGREKNRDFDDP